MAYFARHSCASGSFGLGGGRSAAAQLLSPTAQPFSLRQGGRFQRRTDEGSKPTRKFVHIFDDREAGSARNMLKTYVLRNLQGDSVAQSFSLGLQFEFQVAGSSFYTDVTCANARAFATQARHTASTPQARHISIRKRTQTQHPYTISTEGVARFRGVSGACFAGELGGKCNHFLPSRELPDLSVRADLPSPTRSSGEPPISPTPFPAPPPQGLPVRPPLRAPLRASAKGPLEGNP